MGGPRPDGRRARGGRPRVGEGVAPGGLRARPGPRGGMGGSYGARGPGGAGGGGPGRGGRWARAAPGRRSPRPCPSGRSGPWRRRGLGWLARSAFGPSAPAPVAASTGSARRPALLLVRGSSGCHVGQALKGPRRGARPGRALKGPRTARGGTARRGSTHRALRPRPRSARSRPPRTTSGGPSRPRPPRPRLHPHAQGPAHHAQGSTNRALRPRPPRQPGGPSKPRPPRSRLHPARD